MSGVKGRSVKPRKRRLARMTLTAFTVALIARRERPDVIHFHDPELLPWMVLLTRFRRTTPTLIFDVHEIPKEISDRPYIPTWLRPVVLRTYMLLDRIFSRFVNHIVLASDACGDLYTNHKSVTTIRNFPLTDMWKVDSESQQANRSPTLMYAGVIAPERGLSQMIMAANILNRREITFQLRIVGIASDAFRSSLEEQISGFGLSDIVSIEPPVDHSTIPALLAGADVLLATSLPTRENLASVHTKIFEYMLAAKPIVASNFPAWQPLLAHRGAGLLVNPLQPTEIADAVEKLLNDPESAHAMGQAGRKMALEMYSWDSEAEKLRTLYMRIRHDNVGH